MLQIFNCPRLVHWPAAECRMALCQIVSPPCCNISFLSFAFLMDFMRFVLVLSFQQTAHRFVEFDTVLNFPWLLKHLLFVPQALLNL